LAGVVVWIILRLILGGGFQSPDPDFDDAAKFQCRPAGQAGFSGIRTNLCNRSASIAIPRSLQGGELSRQLKR
jgi:hypothetical protein